MGSRGALRFDLSAADVSSSVAKKEAATQAATALLAIQNRPLVPQCQPCDARSIPSAITFANLMGRASHGATPPPFDRRLLGIPVGLGLKRHVNPEIPVQNECDYVDQYEVVGRPDAGFCGRLCELLHGVAIRNEPAPPPPDPPGRRPKTWYTSVLLGPTGHYERSSFWTHVAGAVVFAVYAMVRQIVLRTEGVDAVLTAIAAWSCVVVFLASSLYHGTSPDPHFARVARMIDFGTIYAGIALGGLADIAVATSGFVNVPYQTVLDLPLAATVVLAFFVWRRAHLPNQATWSTHGESLPEGVECSLGRGLFARGHKDLHHGTTRESTSLLLATSYFMAIPAVFGTLDAGVAVVVVSLQAAAFLVVLAGMMLDSIWKWPNWQLERGQALWLACPKT